SDTLNKVYKPDELVRQWTTGHGPESWNGETAYYQDAEVLYDGVVYVAIENDSAGGPPPGKQEKWTVKLENEEIFQPDDIQQLDFAYRIVFTKSGKLISKEVVSIGLRCAHDFS